MSPVKNKHVVIGTDRFRVRPGSGNFIRRSEAVMVPRSQVAGEINAENLEQTVWTWTLSDPSGGEGRLVFDRNDPLGPPAYKQTDGGIDTRTKGQFSMQPLPTLLLGGTETTVEGSTLSVVAGSPTVSASNMFFDTTSESAQTPANHTPGGIAVEVNFRISSLILSDGSTPGDLTRTVSFTGTAGKAYRYRVTFTSATTITLLVRNQTDSTDTASTTIASTEFHPTRTFSSFYSDYIQHVTGTVVNDPRALFHGRADNIVVADWDGTNTDLYKWNFSTSTWDSLHSNARASQIRAYASTYTNDYFAYDDQTVWKSDGTTHSQYLAAGSDDAWALAVANNRLYYLTLGSPRFLYECTLDGAPGAGGYAVDAAEYKKVMTLADFPNDQSLDNTYRQRMTSIGNGVRFFINSPGGPTSIYEFSEGAGRPLPLALPQGYRATAIHHYMGTTFLGVTFQNQASSPAQTRSAVYYIGADLQPRFLGHLRFHDPDDEPIRYITSYDNDVYFLQGNNIWRYSGVNGGIVLDRTTSASDEAAARGLAVMDRKQWVAYASQGVFVTQNTYPVDNTMYLYSPLHNFDTALDKVLLSFDVSCKPLPANTSITLQYDIDESGTWTTAGTAMTTDGMTGARLAVSGTGADTKTGRVIQWRCGLASSDGVSTPTVRAVTARTHVLDYLEVFEMVLDVSDDSSSNHLAGEQRSGRQKANLLAALKDAKQLVTLEDHYSSKRPGDKDSYTVVLTEVEVDLQNEGEGTARVRAVEVS